MKWPRRLPTYIGYCCREWVMAALHKPGRCGICGETPTYLRQDTFYDEKEES